tara:strand:+ start:326 stop:1084 length:759 start_codon:yes stop_codon:yes gene_type:complete
LLIKSIKHSAFTWIGILGGVLTLLSNIQGILDLAKWADWVIVLWRDLLTVTISNLIHLFGIQIFPTATSMIAMALFVSFIGAGARIENKLKLKTKENWPILWENIFNKRMLLAISLYSLHIILATLSLHVQNIVTFYLAHPYTLTVVFHFLYVASIVIGLRGWPLWSSLTVALSMILFSFIFRYSTYTTADPNISETASTIIAGTFAVFCGLIVVGIAPPIAFTKRIIFMVIGVFILTILSQINKLNIPTIT